MDELAERLSEWFGSVPFIIFHTVWFALWFVFQLDQDLLTLIVSLEAIYLSLFILRAENVQAKRFEHQVDKDIKTSKEAEKDIKAIKRKIQK